MITYPEVFDLGGQRLWQALINADPELDDELNPMQTLAIEACRSQDKCDKLLKICDSELVMLDNGRGQPVAHPAWIEARHQASQVKQLITALRLPDKVTGKRPQRHVGAIHGRTTGIKWNKKSRKGGFWSNNPQGDSSA